MILLCAAILVLFEGLVTTAGWPRGLVPDLYLGFALWVGLRSSRGNSVVPLVALGLAAGMFTAEPWTLRPLQGVVCAASIALMKTAVSAGARAGPWLLAAFGLGCATALEVLWRLSPAAITVSPGVAVELMTRAGLTLVAAPSIIAVLDRSRLKARL